ncbi:eukaryotic integral membrane protein-domain-containing protein [Lanmaoa asiatica]|nr:eukaryotic integral membrane protein-domain-containing protein [Lanmaoa asiatica]
MAILSTPLQYLTSIPPVTRGFTAATIAATSLYLWIWWSTGIVYLPWLTLVPGSSLFYPWTFATSALVEVSIIELFVTMAVIPASLRYFERLWGTVETLKFIVVCVTVPNLIAFAFNWIEFLATRNADLFLYGMQYHGQMALFTSVLVAFTQLIPEHQVQILGFFKVRVKASIVPCVPRVLLIYLLLQTLPMVYLTFSTVMTIIGFQCPYIVIQFGWFVSWVYLRFYKRNADIGSGTTTYGDRSETFALTSWFPPFLHPVLSALGNAVHKVATQFRLIPTSVPYDIESGYSQLPGGARAEAERRRALALKALDQRLANSATNSPIQNGPSTSQSSRTSLATPAPPPVDRKPSPVEIDSAETTSNETDGR